MSLHDIGNDYGYNVFTDAGYPPDWMPSCAEAAVEEMRHNDYGYTYDDWVADWGDGCVAGASDAHP